MSRYRLPNLQGSWKWFVNATNPNAIEVWVYQENGPLSGIQHASTKVLLGTVDAGYNEPRFVAAEILDIAEKSMNWGNWSSVGRKNQDSLYDLLIGKYE